MKNREGKDIVLVSSVDKSASCPSKFLNLHLGGKGDFSIGKLQAIYMFSAFPESTDDLVLWPFPSFAS